MSETELPDPAEMMARLFPRRRVRLVVEADLDPVPGWGHEPGDWQRFLQRTLNDAASHYQPTVTLDHDESPTHPTHPGRVGRQLPNPQE